MKLLGPFALVVLVVLALSSTFAAAKSMSGTMRPSPGMAKMVKAGKLKRKEDFQRGQGR